MDRSDRSPPPTSAPACPGPDPAPRPPRFAVPPGAWDTHAHVFGPLDRYPYAPGRGYTPPEARLADYRAMLAVLGIERAVLVQPSVYGTDNAAMLAALEEAGPAFRGIAVVDDSAGDAELAELHRRGVRGVRVNLLFPGGIDFAAVERLARRIAELGWHLQVLVDFSAFPDPAARLGGLGIDVVVDHMGHVPARLGVGHPGFRALLGLVREGRCWVKLSGAYRTTAERRPPYGDVRPFAEALLGAAPERMLWGSDWPHPAVALPLPNDGELLDLLADWTAGDAALLRQILVSNPESLYGCD